MKIKHLLTPLCLLACLPQVLTALEIEVQPTFHSASVYLREADTLDYAVNYREAGTEVWQPSPELVWTDDMPVPRNSLLGLREDTAYEVEVRLGEELVAHTQFTTLSSEVPVGETITLTGGPVVITQSGTPESWVRYVADADIDAGEQAPNAITLQGVEYVILDGLGIKGGQINAISITDSRHVRVRNCDISGWGRVGERRYDRRGVFYDANGKVINRDSGVDIERSHSVVVEYCYIHDPRGTANSWAFSHPAGPNAIYVVENENTVIRYNDFIGSDAHRWNDVIESSRNGSPDGGFRKDADIYGNTMVYGNDDAMELDGGQMNMRVWGNLIDGTFAGISTAPSFHGPSYIYNNLILESGDRWGLYGNVLKNIYKSISFGSVYFVNNTALHTGTVSGFQQGRPDTAHYVVQNNVLDIDDAIVAVRAVNGDLVLNHNLYWCWDAQYREGYASWLRAQGVESAGVMGDPIFVDAARGNFVLAQSSPGYAIAAAVPGFPDYGTRPGISGPMPLRDAGIHLSRRLVTLDGEAPHTLTVTLDGADAQAFRVLKNDAFGWFEVTASADQLTPEEPVTLSVRRVGPAPLLVQRGAFIVKLADGRSLPVIVRTTGEEPDRIIYADDPGVVALIEAEEMTGAEAFPLVESEEASWGQALLFGNPAATADDPGQVIEATFECPADGTYYLAVRFFAEAPSGSHNSVFLGLNDDPLVETQFRCVPGWNWAGVSRVQELRNKPWFEPIQLKAGEVTLRLAAREKLLLDAIVLAHSPEAVYSAEALSPEADPGES